MAKGLLRSHIGWISLLALFVAVASAAVSASLLAEPPASLRTATAMKQQPVSADWFHDARSVRLSVKKPLPIPLLAPVSGRVTSLLCEPGTTIASGTSPVSLDGQPRLALATRIPLWRDLTLDIEGEDVRAIQEELARLGFPVRSDGAMGPNTVRAAAAAFAQVGVELSAESIPLGSIIWLPAPTVPIYRCETPVGTEVQQGAALATFAQLDSVASIVNPPIGLIPGERVVLIGDARFDIDESGTVRVPYAAEFEVDPMGSADSATSPVEGRLVLREPIEVSVVAPSAVFALEKETGCVTSGGVPHRVKVLGSQLGQTIVLFSGGKPPLRVDTPPAKDKSCT